MLNNGLEDEVNWLLAQGYKRNLKPFGAIGYKHMIKYIDGEWSGDEMLELLARDTRRYAKRQYTWFAKVANINWFKVADTSKIIETIDNWYSRL